MNNIIYKELSDRIIGLALTVHHILGPGLLKSAYEEAMCWELRHAPIPFERQMVYPLKYKGDPSPIPIRKHDYFRNGIFGIGEGRLFRGPGRGQCHYHGAQGSTSREVTEVF